MRVLPEGRAAEGRCDLTLARARGATALVVRAADDTVWIFGAQSASNVVELVVRGLLVDPTLGGESGPGGPAPAPGASGL